MWLFQPPGGRNHGRKVTQPVHYQYGTNKTLRRENRAEPGGEPGIFTRLLMVFRLPPPRPAVIQTSCSQRELFWKVTSAQIWR
jgi:hypothetical protein